MEFIADREGRKLPNGMVVVGLPYAFQGLSRTDEITGGSPYGASTITKPDGSRMPSENELAGALPGPTCGADRSQGESLTNFFGSRCLRLLMGGSVIEKPP
jgi:hypothetical protein